MSLDLNKPHLGVLKDWHYTPSHKRYTRDDCLPYHIQGAGRHDLVRLNEQNILACLVAKEGDEIETYEARYTLGAHSIVHADNVNPF